MVSFIRSGALSQASSAQTHSPFRSLKPSFPSRQSPRLSTSLSPASLAHLSSHIFSPVSISLGSPDLSLLLALHTPTLCSLPPCRLRPFLFSSHISLHLCPVSSHNHSSCSLSRHRFSSLPPFLPPLLLALHTSHKARDGLFFFSFSFFLVILLLLCSSPCTHVTRPEMVSSSSSSSSPSPSPSSSASCSPSYVLLQPLLVISSLSLSTYSLSHNSSSSFSTTSLPPSLHPSLPFLEKPSSQPLPSFLQPLLMIPTHPLQPPHQTPHLPSLPPSLPPPPPSLPFLISMVLARLRRSRQSRITLPPSLPPVLRARGRGGGREGGRAMLVVEHPASKAQGL